jgi:hypothetical protein
MNHSIGFISNDEGCLSTRFEDNDRRARPGPWCKGTGTLLSNTILVAYTELLVFELLQCLHAAKLSSS